MTTKKIKEPIRLRQRKTATGNISLYLDIYLNGRRSYEYLKMYLIPERTKADKEKNRETLQLAEAVKAKRIVQLRNGEFGFRNSYSANTNFYEYYNKIMNDKKAKESEGNWSIWSSCLSHLLQYDKNLKRLSFADITTDWIKSFISYLDNYISNKTQTLSENSKKMYFSKLKYCIKQALEDKIIANNPLAGINHFKGEETVRMYLTVEELRQLVQTPCEYEDIKRAFLFSCLTGLRRSDIEKLTWGDIQQQGGFTRLIFKQKKTKGQEYLDISQQAVDLLGERGRIDEHPFRLFSFNCTNYTIKKWVLTAGINKDITFHCARHTFAVMMLDLGTDIYTVSKLLGHKNLTTTQIYAKVLDKNKQAAVEKIPNILK